jgi:divalent metal cation (Fe/Co/Zn/Cd) transporter
MNPIAQKTFGLGALIGFTITFLSGSPIIDDAFGLITKAIVGGAIFGALGYVVGTLMHRYVVEKIDSEIDAYILEKEMKRKERMREAEEAKATRETRGLIGEGEAVVPEAALPEAPPEGTEGTVGEASTT